MNPERREIAAHTPGQKSTGVRLIGGPWDGKVVWVSDPQAALVQVNGPRLGDHRVWVTHLYERCGDCYEFMKT